MIKVNLVGSLNVGELVVCWKGMVLDQMVLRMN